MDTYTDKRKNSHPSPIELEAILNEFQLLSLRRIQSFGWTLHFVRQPLFQESISIIFNTDNNTFGILENDGSLNMQPNIKFRTETPSPA